MAVLVFDDTMSGIKYRSLLVGKRRETKRIRRENACM